MSENILSTSLAEFAEFFDKPGAVTFNDVERQSVQSILQILRDVAIKQEMEMLAHRQLEANRQGRQFLKDEADKVFGAVPVLQDGNIFRPKFGKDPS